MGLNSELVFCCLAITILACAVSYKTPIRWEIFWLLFATTVSLFFSYDKTKSVSFMMSQGVYIIMFSLICFGKKNYLLFVFMAAMVLVAGKSILEIPIATRTHSFIGWPTATASVLLLGIPIALKMRRPVIATILIVGLLATKSIMPIVSLMVVIGIMYYKRWYILMCGAVLIAIIIFFRGGINETISVRAEYIDAVIRKIIQHPFIGSGIGSFMLTGSNQTIYAHNSYLQIWAETGIIGFFAICALVYKIVQTRPRTNIEIGIYYGILSFLIDNATNFTFLRYTTSIYFWVLLGIYFQMQKKGNVNGA